MTLDHNIWEHKFNVYNPNDSTTFSNTFTMLAKEFSLPSVDMDQWIEHISRSGSPTAKKFTSTYNLIKHREFFIPISEKTKQYFISIDEYDGMEIKKELVFKYIFTAFLKNAQPNQ